MPCPTAGIYWLTVDLQHCLSNFLTWKNGSTARKTTSRCDASVRLRGCCMVTGANLVPNCSCVTWPAADVDVRSTAPRKSPDCWAASLVSERVESWVRGKVVVHARSTTVASVASFDTTSVRKRGWCVSLFFFRSSFFRDRVWTELCPSLQEEFEMVRCWKSSRSLVVYFLTFAMFRPVQLFCRLAYPTTNWLVGVWFHPCLFSLSYSCHARGAVCASLRKQGCLFALR